MKIFILLISIAFWTNLFSQTLKFKQHLAGLKTDKYQFYSKFEDGLIFIIFAVKNWKGEKSITAFLAATRFILILASLYFKNM